LEFNQSEERKPISSLVNFALIGQNLIQIQSQSVVWYGLKKENRQLSHITSYAIGWHRCADLALRLRCVDVRVRVRDS